MTRLPKADVVGNRTLTAARRRQRVWSLAATCGAVIALAGEAPSAEPAPNSWERLPQAEIVGRRWDIPLGFDPVGSRFLVLGGRSTWADYKQPRSYDVLALDESEGRWANAFPEGKSWGSAFGACTAPPWKDEHFRFDDAEGNVRPNWTVYGTFSLGRKWGYDSDTKAFYFYAGGKTFRYAPDTRTWTDLAPATHPEQALGGKLLWSAMCYEPLGKRFILFGGGNVLTARGDPGTWSYSPSENAWKPLAVEVQPPQRANSPLAYDPVHKKLVLFGGDRLDELTSDTWTFDPATSLWERMKATRSPSPRAGHALLWLPKAKKILLVGGYTYTSAVGYVESLYKPLPLELWTLDLGSNTWELLRQSKADEAAPRSLPNACLPAAADSEDRVVATASGAWRVKVDVGEVDADGTAKQGVPEGTTVRRTGPHDPAWFGDGVPPAEPDRVAAELKALPVNRWTLRNTPKLPRPNMDWGSAVFAPEHDQIIRFSGGHSAYSGTAPIVYDVKTDRYSMPFAPEYPIEYVYSNDQVDGEWSFQGRPWMTGHTYKSTGYDRRRKAFVFAPHRFTYFYDPAKRTWSRSEERNPYQPNFYVVTVCDTPEGTVVWADAPNGRDGLWRLDAEKDLWKPLPLTSELPVKSPDQHGMAYDARRHRLLLFSGLGKRAGDVAAYDMKTGQAEWLEPEGRSQGIAHSRETIYLPDLDAVLLGARVPGEGDAFGWLLYDCAKNAWHRVDIPGDDPIARGTFNNSMGLTYDPARRLVWAVGQNSHVHVLRIDASSLKRERLK